MKIWVDVMVRSSLFWSPQTGLNLLGWGVGQRPKEGTDSCLLEKGRERRLKFDDSSTFFYFLFLSNLLPSFQ